MHIDSTEEVEGHFFAHLLLFGVTVSSKSFSWLEDLKGQQSVLAFFSSLPNRRGRLNNEKAMTPTLL